MQDERDPDEQGGLHQDRAENTTENVRTHDPGGFHSGHSGRGDEQFLGTDSVEPRTIRIRPASAPSPIIAAGGLFGNTPRMTRIMMIAGDRHHQIDRCGRRSNQQSADVADEDSYETPIARNAASAWTAPMSEGREMPKIS